MQVAAPTDLYPNISSRSGKLAKSAPVCDLMSPPSRMAFILGLPRSDTSSGASPLMVWEDSHHILRTALARALSAHTRDRWGDVDVTDGYQAARRTVFDTCKRVALPARPGEALLLHRMVLHGVAPWKETATAPAEGRMIAYFRPAIAAAPPKAISDWLTPAPFAALMETITAKRAGLSFER